MSNPPYVSESDDALQALKYEPLSALASGADGLDDIRALAKDCRSILNDDGILFLEHGASQQHQVKAILEAAGWSDIACHNDLAGLPRVTAARRSGK
jgi:release factor glutamine methyltransferase